MAATATQRWRRRRHEDSGNEGNKVLRRKEQWARGSGLRPRRQWQWCPQPTAATAGAGNVGRSGGSARADNNQPKSGSKEI
jgi:hypothetical protein